MKIALFAALLSILACELRCAIAANPTTARVGRTYRIPSSIAADCKRDVTEELNTWLASIPDGTVAAPVVVLFGKNACYQVNGTIGTPYNVRAAAGENRNNLILDGNGATIDGSKFLPPSLTNRAGPSFVHGSRITVRNFTVAGNHEYAFNILRSDPGPCKSVKDSGGYNADYEFHHGIAFFATTDVAVLNNRIYDVYGDGVTLAQGTEPGQHVQRARVEGNTINGTGRMAVAMTAADGVIVRNNVFDRIS